MRTILKRTNCSRTVLILPMMIGILSSCTLTETSLTEPLPNVVVEAYVRVLPTGGGSIFALLHGSVGVRGVSPLGPEASISVRNQDGVNAELVESADLLCAYDSGPEPDPRRCYSAALPTEFAGPGDHLTLTVNLVDGGVIEGGTSIPGVYALTSPESGTGAATDCAVATGVFDLEWTAADDTWAYIADVMLYGVAPMLSAMGITGAVDSVALSGVTVSRTDTDISFPEDFSIDDDIDYAIPLSELLEGGLQSGMTARLSVVAIDRNFTNWVRDQVFNPSGTVRIPSLRGEGTGVFASSVLTERFIATDAASCP